jgi:hypothetical protein
MRSVEPEQWERSNASTQLEFVEIIMQLSV